MINYSRLRLYSNIHGYTVATEIEIMPFDNFITKVEPNMGHIVVT